MAVGGDHQTHEPRAAQRLWPRIIRTTLNRCLDLPERASLSSRLSRHREFGGLPISSAPPAVNGAAPSGPAGFAAARFEAQPSPGSNVGRCAPPSMPTSADAVPAEAEMREGCRAPTEV